MSVTRYKFLGFFSKDGSDLNFLYDENTGIWTGKIHIPQVSVGLYESVNIFIVEEFKTTGGMTKFGVPHISDPTSLGTEGALWSAEWKDDSTEDIFLYQFNPTEDKPIIEVVDVVDIVVDDDISQTVDSVTGQIITDEITSSAIQLNIALNSKQEDIFERTLIIKDKVSNVTIAEIEFYGETVAEDERLVNLLDKLGRRISPKDYLAFRESDINEFGIDFDLINRKRKEMLLEGKNIHPFTGSYKGVINAIKFFGYDNIKLKEYWINVDKDSANFGKFKTTDVIDVFDESVDLNDKNFLLPSKVLKKTSLFALVYRLNRITGELDKFDIEQTEETSEFTLEEVLIKLFGLKEILKNRFLPQNARIVDIIGEADFFTKTDWNVWTDQHEITNINSGIHPDFDVSSKLGFIQDLRTADDILFPGSTGILLDPDLRADSVLSLSEIADVLLAYFTKFGPNLDTVKELPDKPGIPVGFPVVLTNKSFNITWDEAQITWDELSSTGSLIIDFEPENVGGGDTFIIEDKISGESISYTAAPSDDIEDVVNGLKAAADTAAAIGDGNPWSFYSITTEDTDADTELDTIRFRQIFSGALGVEFTSSTIDGGSQGNNPQLNKQFVTGNTLSTWDNFGIGNFYEIEWIITKPAGESPEFSFSTRGDIGDLNSLAIALPFVGKYTIEMRLYDTFNQISSKIKKDHIEVLSREVEFIGFYKFKEAEYTWDSIPKDLTWNEYTATWDLPITPQAKLEEADISWYDSLDRANYILNNENPDKQLSYHHQGPDSPLNTALTKGPYFWDNLGDATWDELTHLTWDFTKVTGDTPANFRIYGVQVGSQLTIEQELPFPSTATHTFNTNNLENALDELNNEEDPVFKKYNYNPVFDENTAGDPELLFIQVVAKNFGPNGDWTQLIPDSATDIRFEQLHETSNPTFDEIKFISDGQVLPKLTYITFTFDKCKIPGKDKPIWNLINTDSPETDNITHKGKVLTYLFKRPGKYSIELKLEDSNGNIKSIKKNMVTIK